MKTNEELAQLARAFYDAYFEVVAENEPASKVEAFQAQFHAIHSVASGFMGALIDSFYQEPPWTRFFFATVISLRSIPIAGVGCFSRVWTREEAITGWNAGSKALSAAPLDMWKTEDESAGRS